jgi:hypothetical protein
VSNTSSNTFWHVGNSFLSETSLQNALKEALSSDGASQIELQSLNWPSEVYPVTQLDECFIKEPKDILQVLQVRLPPEICSTQE